MSEPKYKFGLLQAVSLVVGNVVGSGVLFIPATLAAYGSFGLVGLAATSVGAVFLGLVFADLSHRYSQSGGPYTYTRNVLGNFVGFQVAWTYWMANTISNIAIVLTFMGYLSAAYPLLFSSKWVSLGVSLGALWGLVGLNMLGLRFFAAFQTLITVLKILPLAVLSVIGFSSVHMDHILPLTLPPNMGWDQALLATMSLSIFSFIGIESATIPSESVANPKKTVARATLIGTFLAAGIYLWLNMIIIGILGVKSLAQSQAPFVDAFASLLGGSAGFIMALIGAFACFSTLNGWLMIQAQIPMAASQDGMFPAFLGRLTSRGVPGIALVLSSLLMTVLIIGISDAPLVSQFSFIVTLTSFSILLPYFAVALAELVLLVREKEPLARSWPHLMVVVMSLLYTMLAIQGVGVQSFLLGAGLVVVGVPIYWWGRRRQLD